MRIKPAVVIRNAIGVAGVGNPIAIDDELVLKLVKPRRGELHPVSPGLSLGHGDRGFSPARDLASELHLLMRNTRRELKRQSDEKWIHQAFISLLAQFVEAVSHSIYRLHVPG